MSEHAIDRDVTALLGEWLPAQRWYGDKGRGVRAVRLRAETVLDEFTETAPGLAHWVVRVSTADGGAEDYQLLVGRRHAVHERLDHVVIGEFDGAVLYDGLYDSDLIGGLLPRIAAGEDVGSLHFSAEETAEALQTDLASLVSSAEQSNTSVIFGNIYICKFFRKLHAGLNPDLQIHRALARVGCEHIAAPRGAIEGALDGEPVTFAMLQDFVANASDGWQMATTSVRDLYAEADLHASEVGGDFAGEAHRLGSATAQVHADLARALGSTAESAHGRAGLAQQMRERLAAAIAVVPELLPYAESLRAVYDRAAQGADLTPMRIQRVHGDYHLGQVLRTMYGWVVLDFEGEPARPFDERTAQMSPLRDVAGMLRSFDYASRHLLADHPGDQQLEYRAGEWAQRNRDAFLDGYSALALDLGDIREPGPDDPRAHADLLRAFELDKAVYEVVYEARNRPSWLPIPLGSIARLVA